MMMPTCCPLQLLPLNAISFHLLTFEPESIPHPLPISDFAQKQKKHLEIMPLLQYLESKVLPQCSVDAHKIAAQIPLFTVEAILE